jgi:dipeptidyl aminopeptidase/acylaminoacyl peptidase
VALDFGIADVEEYMLLRLSTMLTLLMSVVVLILHTVATLLLSAPQLSFTGTIHRNESPDFYLYDTVRQLLVPLLGSTDSVMTPVWSPDGNQIAYVSTASGRGVADSIAIYDIRGNHHNRVFFSRRAEAQVRQSPLWSPAQDNLAFYYGIPSMARGVRVELIRLQLPEQSVVQVTLPGIEGADQNRLRWRDDTHLVSVSINVERLLVQEIALPHLRTRTLHEWQMPFSNYRMPAIAHDTRRILIAAITSPSNAPDLHLFDIETGEYRNLTNSAFVHETQPVWSHDDTLIAYQVLNNPYNAVGFATPDGMRRWMVYLNDIQALNIWDLQWTPDNSAVVFGASMPGGQHLCFLQVGDELPKCPLRMQSLGGISWRPAAR